MPSGLGDSIRKGVGMVHGTGEAIRGQFNAAVDNAAGDKTSATKNQEIAQKGVDEWDRGYRGHALGEQPAQGVGHHVPPPTTTEQANTTHSTSTNYGPHSTNVGNKLDPRFDSDTDHRGTATSSTNYGPHSTNVGNKLDPSVDSDMDHRANPVSGMGPSTTTTHPTGAGGAYDSTNAGPHRSNFANKIDPRVDSDVDHRANPNSAVGMQGAAVGDVGGTAGMGMGSSNAGPHASNLGNKVDPRVDSDFDHRRNQGPGVGGGPTY